MAYLFNRCITKECSIKGKPLVHLTDCVLSFFAFLYYTVDNNAGYSIFAGGKTPDVTQKARTYRDIIQEQSLAKDQVRIPFRTTPMLPPCFLCCHR